MSENSGKNLSNSGGDWRGHVQNMVKCCEVIIQSIRGLDQGLFCINDQVNSFYIVRVILIGEAVRSIPMNKQDLHSEVDWVYWKDTRNRLAHMGNKANEDVSMGELWEICKYKIPKLLPLIKKILENSEHAEEPSD